MRLLYFSIGSGLESAKSGGNTRFIEVAKRLFEKNIEITIVCTSGAIELFKAEGLEADFIKVRASIFSNKERSNIGRAWSYVISTIHSLFIIHKLPHCELLHSPSDYFCDVIPSIYYKMRNNDTYFTSMIHHLCRHPKERKGGYLINSISYISQKFTHKILSKFSDSIFVYDTPEGEKISQYFAKKQFNNIEKVFNGINFSEISSCEPHSSLSYDACFVGGLRKSKGLFDLISIWKIVLKTLPNARIAVIGAGTESVTKNFERKISLEGLSDNFELLGELSSKDLFVVMKSCKLFLSTSHEEGWGISVCEALACKLPVIAFNLPAFSYLDSYIIKIERLNHQNFAENIIELLDSPTQRFQYAGNGFKFIEKYNEYQILKGRGR